MECTEKEMLPQDVLIYHTKWQEIADRWPLLSNTWIVVTILTLYLWFVTKAGPKFMRNREPFSIKPVIVIYNVYQVSINLYFLSELFVVEGALEYMWNHSCHREDPNENHLAIPYLTYGWMYFISRMIDLLDTVFFVLTKKQDHVTFLHVFHHTMTVLLIFYVLKYTIGEQAVLFAVCNAFVHVIMYTYYFLAAFGPRFRKWLWWKSYLTLLQLAQFFIIGAHSLALIIFDCPVPRNVSRIIVILTAIYAVLFSDFYWKTYIMRKHPGKKIKPIG